jgi:hypothetical protein
MIKLFPSLSNECYDSDFGELVSSEPLGLISGQRLSVEDYRTVELTVETSG